MYQNPLVITDNVYLAGKFRNFFDTQFPEFTCKYAISSNSDYRVFSEQEIETQTLDLRKESTINKIIENHDLVFSIHCKQLFPARLVQHVKSINVHPGYNPYNRGWYPQVFAIVYDLPIGATIHEMDEHLDHGPIIARRKVEKHEWDTSGSLYARVLEAEVSLLEQYLPAIMKNDYETILPEEEGQVFLKKDFKALCHLDLNKKVAFKEAINILRALTHGEYMNAFYMDEKGKKVFIKVLIQQNE